MRRWRCSTHRREQNGPDANLDAMIDALGKSVGAAQLMIHRLTTLADAARTMAMAMEFGFLFDPDRQLLSIGYRCNDGALDSNCYDLLASEARLASFSRSPRATCPRGTGSGWAAR